jgi:hypothetical protein
VPKEIKRQEFRAAVTSVEVEVLVDKGPGLRAGLPITLTRLRERT